MKYTIDMGKVCRYQIYQFREIIFGYKIAIHYCSLDCVMIDVYHLRHLII